MKKLEIKHLDLYIYSEKLENGLEIYIIPKNNINNIYSTFSTKYGSNQIEFVPIDKKKMINVPLGIAHFLEHKLFEQKDGIDPFTFYNDRGSDANANTDQIKTTYLFSGPSFVKENLNYLLDYVQDPYFTDQNVEKEKGIITQEIKMYQDDPITVLYETLLKNTFVNHPIKNPIIGSIDSINSITKEDLYTCYNTFYHPSNMFVVITGNVVPSEIIELIKKNQDNKKFKKLDEIKIKQYKEPDEVAVKHEETSLNVSIPKCAISYKIKIDYKNIYEESLYLLTLFDSKFGNTSTLVKELFDDKIITEQLYIDYCYTDNHIAMMVFGNSNNPEELLKRINKEIKNLDVDIEEFERKKKTLLSSLIYMSDSIFSLNNTIMNDIVKFGKVNVNRYDKIKNLNYNDFNKYIKSTNFNNFSTIIIKTHD